MWKHNTCVGNKVNHSLGSIEDIKERHTFIGRFIGFCALHIVILFNIDIFSTSYTTTIVVSNNNKANRNTIEYITN
jgi:hypothetical protein